MAVSAWWLLLSTECIAFAAGKVVIIMFSTIYADLSFVVEHLLMRGHGHTSDSGWNGFDTADVAELESILVPLRRCDTLRTVRGALYEAAVHSCATASNLARAMGLRLSTSLLLSAQDKTVDTICFMVLRHLVMACRRIGTYRGEEKIRYLLKLREASEYVASDGHFRDLDGMDKDEAKAWVTQLDALDGALKSVRCGARFGSVSLTQCLQLV